MTIHANQIDHLLQYIGADDYQNWIKVGMGLKSEFGDRVCSHGTIVAVV